MDVIGEIVKELLSFAKQTGVGFSEVIVGIVAIILAVRSSDIIKTIGDFINQRSRILAKNARQHKQASAKIDQKRKKLIDHKSNSKTGKEGD